LKYHGLLLLLLQKEVLGCPAVCQLCTGRQVTCRNLGLSSIPRNFPKTTILVYFSGNNISHVIPNELTGLQKLAALYMDNSSISYVHPKAFVDLPKLCYLHLNNNNIKRLFSDLLSVRYLTLQRNRLNKLRYLSLKSVKLKHIAVNGFFGLSNLNQLILSYNDLENINSSTFTSLNSLRYLQLDRNKITSIGDNAFEKMGQSLKILNLAFNNITELQPKVLKPLWTLFANCSSLTASPEGAWNLESADTHHNPTTLLMAWHKGNRRSPFEQFIKADTKYITLWEGTAVTSASPLPHGENTAAETPSQAPTVLSVLPVQIPAQIIPVTGTIEVKSLFPTDAAPVSLQTSVLCTQQVEKLNQAFDVLLSFFVLNVHIIYFAVLMDIKFLE
uniref:Leucine rich repeat containing 70 n=1 Tax=Phasianus colchicus TaxID=9054 RepID=A0A669QCJ7_PHACC